RFRALALVLARQAPLFGFMVAALLVSGGGAEADSASEIFRIAELHQFYLRNNASDRDRRQPARRPRRPPRPGGRHPAPPPAPGPRAAGIDADAHRSGGFGLTFPWAHAHFTAAGQTHKNVGIRFKGNASYMASARGLKRNFKIDFNHYDENQSFHGLKSINLNAGAMDPTKARE